MQLPGGIRSLRELVDYLAREIELRVVGQDAKPRPGKVVLFVRKNGSGKTELCVQHPTGAEEVISTEP